MPGFANLVYDISKKLSDDGKLFQVHFTKQGDSPLKDFASTGNQQGAADSLWAVTSSPENITPDMMEFLNAMATPRPWGMRKLSGQPFPPMRAAALPPCIPPRREPSGTRCFTCATASPKWESPRSTFTMTCPASTPGLKGKAATAGWMTGRTNQATSSAPGAAPSALT